MLHPLQRGATAAWSVARSVPGIAHLQPRAQVVRQAKSGLAHQTYRMYQIIPHQIKSNQIAADPYVSTREVLDKAQDQVRPHHTNGSISLTTAGLIW